MVASNGNTGDFQCRKINNLKMSPDNIKHCYIKLPNEHTPECLEKLIQIGIIEPIHIVEGIPTGEIKSDYALIFPKWHISLTNPKHDRNISSAEGYIFAQLRSTQNVQMLMYLSGANTYIFK